MEKLFYLLKNIEKEGNVETLCDMFPTLKTAMTCSQNNENHCYTVGEHTICVIKNVVKTEKLLVAALFHDFGKITTKTTDENGVDHFFGHAHESALMVRPILEDIGFDKTFIDDVCVIIDYHDTAFETKKSIKRFIEKFGKDLLLEVLKLRQADVMAQNPNFEFMEKLMKVEEVKVLIAEIETEALAFSKKDMKISAKELMALGVKPGPQLGEILNKLFELCKDNPDLNTEETLLEKAKEMLA